MLNGTGKYNLVPLPLEIDSIINADTLAAYIGSGVQALLKHNAATQTFQTRVPGAFGTNFSVFTDDAIFVLLDENASSVISFVGRVPAPGEVSFTLVPGDANGDKYNFLTLPLDRDDLTNADEVAADIGGVEAVMKYNATPQTFQTRVPGEFGTNFDLDVGDPFIVLLNSSAPTTWH